MDAHARLYKNNAGKWTFDDYKLVKFITGKKPRIAFQKKGKYTRGLSITIDGFHKMEDVTITPGMEICLEKNVYLKQQGKCVVLKKLCHTHDNKPCDGGFFQFTMKEWLHFWTTMRHTIEEYVK